jgi:hypothetical protein
MGVPKVLFTVRWNWPDVPERTVMATQEAAFELARALKIVGALNVSAKVEATSARLPAPGTESIQSVDHGMVSPQARRHAAPRVDEPLIGTEARHLRDRLRDHLQEAEDDDDPQWHPRTPEDLRRSQEESRAEDDEDESPDRGCRGCSGTCCTGVNGEPCTC